MHKKILFLFISFLILNNSFSQVINFQTWDAPYYKAAHISFLLYDLKNNKNILEKDAEKAMVPASTMKLFTTATAIEKLGAKHQFETKIYVQGLIDKKNHSLNGNLIIKGFGDPSMGSKYFYNEDNKFAFTDSIIKILKDNSLSKINGKIIIDASEFSDEVYAPSTAWDDMANYYAPGTYAISIFDNLYKIYFNSPVQSNQKTKINKIEPFVPNLVLDNRVLSSNENSDQAYIYGQAFNYHMIIRGTIPKNKTNFIVKGAIPNPNLYFAYIVDSLLNLNGIKTKHLYKDTFKSEQNLQFIGKIFSPKLSELIYFTNKKSVNQYADQLAANLALTNHKKATIKNGTDVITEFWENKMMPTEGFFMADGSGLSRHNRLSASQLVYLLNQMRKSDNYNIFANSLPENGKNGTLKSFGKNKIPHSAIWAKTGSFRQVRAMAGYIQAKSGNEYSFALIINDYEASGSTIKKDMENFFTQIYLNY